MAAMTGFACALEPHLIKEIDEAMEYLNFARSERYRNLIILGLDEYAISGSELRRKRFPINGEIGKAFTIMLPDAINKEIVSVKKKRNQIKKLAIRYIVLLGFEKWKRDQDNIKCQKVETPGQENTAISNLINNGNPVNFKMDPGEKVEPKIEAVQKSFKPWQRKLAEDKPGRCFIEKHNYKFDESLNLNTNVYGGTEHTTIPSEFHKNKMAGPDPEIKPGSHDMNIGEKFQAVIDLVRELDLKITIEKK